MQSVTDFVNTAKQAVTNLTQSGTEPPSGVQGQGTIDRPYDGGNLPEQEGLPASASGTEPPAGYTGAGTATQPFDRGNEPEQAVAPGTEPPSGLQGQGTAEKPFDKGNQPEQDAVVTTTGASNTSTGTSSTGPLLSAATQQSSSETKTDSTPAQQEVMAETRGRAETEQRTTSTPDPTEKQSTGATARSGHFDNPSTRKYEERDVSPGELKDGTHATTSGDRGESYQPGKLNKFKDKFGIGRDRH